MAIGTVRRALSVFLWKKTATLNKGDARRHSVMRDCPARIARAMAPTSFLSASRSCARRRAKASTDSCSVV
jgi:predicted Fe-S protein YdhL (DUF1289 family)